MITKSLWKRASRLFLAGAAVATLAAADEPAKPPRQPAQAL